MKYWKPEMDDLLQALAASKKSAQEIAVIFQKNGYEHVTRDSVLGRCHRARFRLDKSLWTAEMDALLKLLIEKGKSSSEALAVFHEKGHASLTRSALVGRSHRFGVRFPKKKTAPRAIIPIHVPELPIDFQGGVAFTDLSDFQCHYAISPSNAMTHKFCGETAVLKSRYCALHDRLTKRN